MDKTITENIPRVAVDAVLFSVDNGQLKVLLLKIDKGPYKGKWCVPGGQVGYNESLVEAVKSKLFQKTNITGVYLEQLYTFGDPKRDVRSRSISVAYFALVGDPNILKIKPNAYVTEQIKWTPLDKLPDLAFDHKKVIEKAHERLKNKVNYSNIVYSLLPKEFTLSQLQNVYEIIMQQKLDKRNFRKKMLALGLLEKSNKKQTGQAFRPAELYRFVHKKLVFV